MRGYEKQANFQRAIVRLLNRNNIFFFANYKEKYPNKTLGFIKGMPDLTILLPNKCVFVELKNGYNGYHSLTEQEFGEKVVGLGFDYIVWGEIIDAEFFIKKYKGVVK